VGASYKLMDGATFEFAGFWIGSGTVEVVGMAGDDGGEIK